MDVKLVMFKPDGRRKDIPITTDTTVIGRGENCDLRVPLLSVSRRHTEVSIVDGVLKVKDLASSNGTYVNNGRVNESVLEAGDRLVVGPVVFTVQIDGVPEEISPVQAGENAGGADEIIDLEADVIVGGGGDDDAITRLESTQDDMEDIDPISALEALAADSEKRE